MSGDSGISAFPEEENIFCWKGTITGSKDTVFEGTEYKLSLSFPNDYPFKPPKVKFETACFHPNVDLHGNICLDILQVIIASETILFGLQFSFSFSWNKNNQNLTNIHRFQFCAKTVTFWMFTEKGLFKEKVLQNTFGKQFFVFTGDENRKLCLLDCNKAF